MKTVGDTPATKGGVLPPLVLTAGREYPLAFYAQPVHNFDEFEAMVKRPDPSKFGYYDKSGWVADTKAPAYIDQLHEYSRLRWAYTILKSLEPSKIGWDKVNLSDPKTWKYVHDEIKEILSYNEIGLLIGLIEEANSLDSDKLDQNRQTFFQVRELLARDSDSQNIAVESTASSVLVPDSVSSPPV